MKKVYLRGNYSIKNISWWLFISLIALIIGGFYKNGLKLYQARLVSEFGLVKPLIMALIGFLIGLLVNLIYESLIKKNKDSLLDIVFSSFHPLYGLLVASVISINTGIFLFIVVTFSIFLLSKFFPGKFNVVALAGLVIILVMALTDSFSFLNVYEAGKVFHLTLPDYLLGMGSGGINTTYIIFLIISLIILANQEYYKRVIPLFSTLTLTICLLAYGIFNKDLLNSFNLIFTNSILFSFIYLATDFLSSSYTRRGKILYSSLIGLITFILLLIYPPIAALGAVFITSLLHSLIDKFFRQKSA